MLLNVYFLLTLELKSLHPSNLLSSTLIDPTVSFLLCQESYMFQTELFVLPQIKSPSIPSLFQKTSLLTQLLKIQIGNLFLLPLFPSSHTQFITKFCQLLLKIMLDLTSTHHCLCNSPSSIFRTFRWFFVLYSCLLQKTARMIRWLLKTYQCLITAK